MPRIKDIKDAVKAYRAGSVDITKWKKAVKESKKQGQGKDLTKYYKEKLLKAQQAHNAKYPGVTKAKDVTKGGVAVGSAAYLKDKMKKSAGALYYHILKEAKCKDDHGAMKYIHKNKGKKKEKAKEKMYKKAAVVNGVETGSKTTSELIGNIDRVMSPKWAAIVKKYNESHYL